MSTGGNSGSKGGDGSKRKKKSKAIKASGGSPHVANVVKTSNAVATLPSDVVRSGIIPPVDPNFFKEFVKVHPQIMKKYMVAAKAGKLPGRTVHHGGGVAAGEHSMLWWLAQQLSDRIIGETAAQTLARGHKNAADRAEKQLVKAATKAADKGPPLVVTSDVPKVNFSINVQRKARKQFGGRTMTSVVLSGTDLIGDVTVPSGTLTGDVLIDQVIAPGAFNNTRLQQFSYLFDKYYFETVKFHYSPIVDATTDGAIISFPDYDPDDDLHVRDGSNLRKAAAHMGNKIVQVWDKQTWELHHLRKDAVLFTDPASTDDRLTQQGRFTILAAADGMQAQSIGLLTMTYECHFFITQIDNNPPFSGVQFSANTPTSPTAAKPFGTSNLVIPGSNLSVEYVGSGTNSKFILPQGATTHKYIVVCHFTGTTLGALTVSTTAPDVLTTEFNALNAGVNDIAYMGKLVLGGTSIDHQLTFLLASAAAVTTAQIWIWPVPEDFTQRRNKFVVKEEIYELKSQVAQLVQKLMEKQDSESSDLEPDGEEPVRIDSNGEEKPVQTTLFSNFPPKDFVRRVSLTDVPVQRSKSPKN